MRLVERSVASHVHTRARDGHAPKLLLITSILLPLTEHYRALESLFLPGSPVKAPRRLVHDANT